MHSTTNNVKGRGQDGEALRPQPAVAGPHGITCFFDTCMMRSSSTAIALAMEDYICVSLNDVEVLELDCEDDGSYHLSSLSALVGCEAAGLRYKNDCTGNFRGVKVTTDGELLQPRGGWGSRVYSVVVKDSTGSYSSCETSFSQPGDDSRRSQPVPHTSTSKGANHTSPQPQPSHYGVKCMLLFKLKPLGTCMCRY